MFSTYPRTRLGPFDSAATERATTPRATSDGIVTRRKEPRPALRGEGSEEVGVLDGALGAWRQIEQQQIERPPLERPEDLTEQRELPRGAPRVRLSLRGALEIERLRLRDQRAHREDADSVAGPRERDLLTAGNEQRTLNTGHAGLRRAVEVRVEDRNPKPPRTQRAGEMQRQRALADSALAGADGHEMAHPGEPVGDARALLGNLLEDLGSSVADDVVVALHRAVSQARVRLFLLSGKRSFAEVAERHLSLHRRRVRRAGVGDGYGAALEGRGEAERDGVALDRPRHFLLAKDL